jgi:hypothetical protein
VIEILTVIVLAVGLLAVAAAIGVDVGRRRERAAAPAEPEAWLDAVTRRRLLVQTTDGQTIEGSLARVDADGIILAPARHSDSGQDLAGEVWVPRDRVSWIQGP